MAMLLGLEESTRTALRKKDGWIFIDYLSEEELSIIKAIAVFEMGNLNILLDKDKMFTIAEEYAATGIRLLKERVFSGGYGTFAKKFESDLVTVFENVIKSSIDKPKGIEVKKKSPAVSRVNPLLENAMYSFTNALEFCQKNEERHRQATIVEMDQAVEYIFKALLFQVNSTEFMEKDWEHLTYDKAMKKVEDLGIAIPSKSLLQKAHSARNKAQHRGIIASASWMRVHLKNVYCFLNQFCTDNFQFDITKEIPEDLLLDFINSS